MTEVEFELFKVSHPNAVPKKKSVPAKKETPAKEEKQSGKETKKKKPKYFNHKVYVYQEGIGEKGDTSLGKLIAVFDSVAEYNRQQELLNLQRAGIISNLERQARLIIQEKFKYRGEKIRAIYYVADFRYVDKNGCTVVEDVKAYDKKRGKYRTTADFDLKWKLLKYRYPDVTFSLYGKQD